MKRTLVYGATIVSDGHPYQGSVLLEGGKIGRIFREGSTETLPDEASCERVDATGMYLLPGVIDTHVHFREPGMTEKGTMASESRAAVAGGVTSFMDMPNTRPLTTTLEAWNDKMEIARATSAANYAFYLGATADNADTIEKADYSRVCGIKLFMGSSTGNMLVDTPASLDRLFSASPALLAVHCESESLIRTKKALYTATYGDDLPVRFHSLIRDEEVCYESSALAVALARKYGTRLHLMHISTARELELLEAGSPDGKRITAETCPHYLWFSQDDYDCLGPAIKCNPAIKTAADRAALRQALTEGLIDTVSTDHAPHLWSQKQGGALKAASGSPSVQFSLVLMMELMRRGVFTPETVVEKMCHAPARLYAIDRRGYIREGYYADLVLVDTVAEGYTLGQDAILSPCGWSPYVGENLHYRVHATFVNGEKVYDERTGVSAVSAAMPLKFLR